MSAAGSALLVVDMQNDFCLPDAILRVEGAMGCLPMVIRAVAAARAENIPVIWVVREHSRNGLDVEKYRQSLYTDGQGACLAGSSGAALVDGLSLKANDVTVVKKRFSGFFGTNLDSLLRRLKVTTVVIAGVQTPNCIRATAFDAMALDYNVTVLSNATAAKTEAVHEANLHDMREVAIHTPTVAGWERNLTVH